MSLFCSVGGARAMFEDRLATEVADVLDQTFGDGDWDDFEHQRFGELNESNWAEFRDRAVAALGAANVPNLLALKNEGRVVYLPSNVQTMTLRVSAGSLRCASLPGLRRELFELADRWELPLEDQILEEILKGEDEGSVADAPEVLAFARLALAANEAMRRDCPLWLIV